MGCRNQLMTGRPHSVTPNLKIATTNKLQFSQGHPHLQNKGHLYIHTYHDSHQHRQLLNNALKIKQVCEKNSDELSFFPHLPVEGC